VATLVVWLASLIACAAIAWRADYSSDLSAFLPRHADASQRLLVDQLRDGVASRLLLVGMSGAAPAQLAGASRGMVTRLRSEPAFVYVQNGDAQATDAERAWVFEHRYQLSDAVVPGHFGAAALHQSLIDYEGLLGSTLGLLAKRLLPADPTGEVLHLIDRLEGEGGPARQNGVWFARTQPEALLIAQTRAPGFDTDGQAQALAAIDRAWQQAQQEAGAQGATLEIAGPGVYAVASRDRIRGDARRLSLIATGLIALLLLAVFRSPRVLVLGLLPVISGALAGVAAVALAFGTVHGITLGFGVTMIGEAVDYGIYFFTAVAIAGTTGTAAGRRAELARLWPTLRLGTLTSICGFAAMLFSGLSGLSQLGVFSVAGLVAAFAVTRWVLPVLAPSRIVIARFAARADARRSPIAHSRGAGALLLALALAACATLAFLHGRVWEEELSKLSPISEEEKARDARLRGEIGAPDVRAVLVAYGASEQAALEAAEDLSPTLQSWMGERAIGAFDSPALYFPSARAQRLRQSALPDRAQLERDLARAVVDTPFAASIFAPFVAAIETARTAPPLTKASLAGTGFALKADSLLVKSGDHWAALLPLRGVTDIGALSARASRLDGARYGWLDLKSASASLVSDYRQETLTFAAFGALCIVALLSWQLRSARRALRIVVPLAAAVLVTAALTVLFGHLLTLFHLVALLLVVGIGSNYALFFERTRNDPAERARTALALSLCCTTTIIAFGLLAISATPVLRAIGGTVALGAVLALVYCAVLIRPDRPLSRPELR